MTRIRAATEAPSRRPGVLGVHSIDHVHIAVSKMDEAQRFYGAFGLDLREKGDALNLCTSGHPQRWAAVTEGKCKALQHLSFGAFEDDLPRFRKRLEAMRIPRAAAPRGFESNGLWFRDPDGLLLEIRVAEKNSPNAKPPGGETAGQPGIQNAPSRSTAPKVHPKRLAHVLTFTRDVPKTLKFYGEVLGLGLSDRSGDAIGFMHGVHGSDHHMIAFLKSEAPGLHHLSWDMGSIHSIGLGAMQMANAGYRKSWGLGRHVLGSNYFHYIRDPWGSWCEYACDIDYIPADATWPVGDHPAEDAFYVWGPDPPPEFAINYEAQNG
jgi:catechol 2,3-dioxygenase-like lactoylglutathione lyase family enzyme